MLTESVKTTSHAGILRVTAGAAAGALAFAIIARYPIAPAALAIGGIVYAAALWWRPSYWLVLLPSAIIVVNLAPWTGWLYIGESDVLFFLTIAVLLVRYHVQADDLRLGWMTVLIVGFYAAYCCFSIWRGYIFAGGAPGTNPYISPENAFRVGKGVIESLLLLPFLVHAWRTERDAGALFSAGMTLALLAVAICVMFERMLFVGPFYFESGYRVAGPFGGMHIGGGYIGTFFAMTLPFAAVGLAGRSPVRALAVIPFAGYAFLVTFTRTAYAAAAVGCLLAITLITVAALRGRLRLGVLALGAVLVGAIVGAAALGVKTDFMRQRLLAVSSDYDDRHANWLWGIAEFPTGLAGDLLGNGLGTFPRVHRAFAEPPHQAVDFAVRQDHGDSYLTLGSGSTLYFGQKIAIEHRTKYNLELEIRSVTPGARLDVLLCWKYLLYSDDCASTTLTPSGSDWTPVRAVLEIDTAPLDRVQRRLPWLTDLAFCDPVLRSEVDLRHVHFLDPDGRNILVNGDFTRGTERWNFTSDDHLMWRIMNQFLMEISEEGWLGLAAFSLLIALAFARASRAGIGGDLTGAAIAGSLAAFLVSAIFDSLLDEPRLSTVFHLICFAGILMTTKRDRDKSDRYLRRLPQVGNYPGEAA